MMLAEESKKCYNQHIRLMSFIAVAMNSRDRYKIMRFAKKFTLYKRTMKQFLPGKIVIRKCIKVAEIMQYLG